MNRSNPPPVILSGIHTPPAIPESLEASPDMAAVVAAQPRPGGDIPVVQPTHQIAFPGVERIHSVSFSTDGKTAYALVDGRAVDIWAALVSVWPEVLGALVLVAILLWAGLAQRVRTRPQLPGMPYCRKCNYNVVAQAPAPPGAARDPGEPSPASRCPECGTDLARRKPRSGRTAVRRLWLPTTLAAIAIVGYTVMLAAGLPRSGPAARWLGLWSGRVDAIAERHQIPWLQKHAVQVARVVRVATETGAILGTLHTRRDYPTSEMLTTPDGRHLIFTAADSLVRVCTSSGWATTTDAGGSVDYSIGNPGLVGFDGADSDYWVYYAVALQEAQRSRLMRWRPSTGQKQVVIDEPGYKFAAAGGSSQIMPRRYALLRWSEGIATISAPDFMESYRTSRFVLTVLSPIEHGGAALREIDITGNASHTTPLVAARDGHAVYASQLHRGVIDLDPRSGDQRPDFARFDPTSVASVALDKLTLSSDGRRVFLAIHGGKVIATDTKARRHIGILRHPKEFIAPSLYASPDGRWLAATPFKSTKAKGGPYIHELFLWDLHQALAPTSAPPNPSSPVPGP